MKSVVYLVKLGFTRISAKGLLSLGRTIVLMMTANPLFASIIAKIKALGTALDELEKADAAYDFNRGKLEREALMTSVVQVSARVILDGPYNEGSDRMSDALRVANVVPTAQPYGSAPFNYSGTETTTSGVLANSDPDNAIVDWVLLELRDNTTPTTIIT